MKKPCRKCKVTAGNTWNLLQQEMKVEKVGGQQGAGTLAHGASTVCMAGRLGTRAEGDCAWLVKEERGGKILYTPSQNLCSDHSLMRGEICCWLPL